QPASGLETSRANGGQISVSYAEPWANPQLLPKLLNWLSRDDSPLAVRLETDPRQWQWMLMFLRECLPSRVRRNIAALVAMAQYSRRTLQEMRSELALDYDQQTRGILSFYRNPHEFERSQRSAEIMRDLGVERRILNADEVVATEPALAPIRDHLVGGDYTLDDGSGDAFAFSQALARAAADAGVEFRYSTHLSRLVSGGGRILAAELIRPDGQYEPLRADAFVAALGSYTPLYMRPLGVA